MNEFRFDLQRFDDEETTTYSIADTTSNKSNLTIKSDDDGKSITYTASAEKEISFNITVNSTTTSYSLKLNSATVKVSTDETGSVILNVTNNYTSRLKSGDNYPSVKLLEGAGNFRPYTGQKVTFGDSSPEFTFSSNNNYYAGLQVSSTSSGYSVTVYDYYTGSTTSYTFTIGEFTYTNQSGQKMNKSFTVDSSGNYSITIPNSSGGTLTYSGNNIVATSGTITLKATADGTAYVTALDGTDSFTYNGVTYTMTGTNGLLKATTTVDGVSKTKYVGHIVSLSTEIPLSDLDFDTGKLVSLCIATDGNLVISSDVITALAEDTVMVADISGSNVENATTIYGVLTKDTTNNIVTLERGDSDNGEYQSITIKDNYTVIINSEITGVPITVEKASTTFSVVNTAGDVSISSSDTLLSINDSNVTGLSLQSGSILTTLSDQTIVGTDSENLHYSVSGYSGGTDGIIISRDTSSVVSVSDIDVNESFSVSTSGGTVSGYTLLSGTAGLLEQTNGTFKIYDSANSFTLGNGNGSLLIAADGGSLDVGGKNTYSAAVFDSSTAPTTKYALLTADNDAYSLSTYTGDDGSNFQVNVSTISLLGGQTTIDKALVTNTTNFVTNTTTFLVTAVSGDTFVVSSGTSTPTVTGATAITLTSGSITTTSNQTITLNGLSRTVSGEGVGISFDGTTATITAAAGKTFQIGNDTFTVGSGNTSGMTLTVTASAITVNAGIGDSLTVNNETYVVGSQSDGMTFAVGSAGSVSAISGLDTTNESFTRNGTGYSVASAGFMTSDSSSYSIWGASGNYTLTGGSVTADNLALASNWLDVVIIDGNVTVPPGTNAGLLIDNSLSNRFGKLETSGNNSATLTGVDSDTGTLSNIYINSGSQEFTLNANGSNFLGVPINAPNATLRVATASNSSYQVTLDGAGGNTGLLGATAASLTSGKLTATDSITIVVDGASVIPGETVTLITDTSGSNASIAGLSYGENFSVNGGAYIFTGAGLRNGSQLKRDTKSSATVSTIALASVVSGDDWLPMLAASVSGGVEIGDGRNISDLFLVDVTTGADSLPSKLYGELTTVSGGYSLSTVTNSDAWEDSYTITVDNTIVTISSGFEGKSINASQAGAAFSVDTLNDSATEFVVTDNSAGVSLSGAKAITQTLGLISASGVQSVNVGNYTIANSSGLSLDVNVADSSDSSKISLSSLDEGESFSISSNSGTIAYSLNSLGLINDNRLFKSSSVLSAFDNVTLSELNDTSQWIYIATVEENILTVPPTVGAADSASEWLVFNNDKSIRYGQISSVSGGLSLTKTSIDSAWGNDTIQIVNNTLSLSSDFSGKTISGSLSGALFTVSDNASYSVLDATSGASVGGNAKTINQTAGTIILGDSTQSIVASEGTISANNGDITVSIASQKATVGKLQSGDSFTVSGVTYTLLSNGKLQRSTDNALWTGTALAVDDSGAVTIEQLNTAANWYGAIETDSNGNLTLDTNATLASATSAYVVNGDDNSIIYGTLTKDSSNNYTLSNDAATNQLNSIIVTDSITAVSVSSALVNIPITSGSNQFTVTSAANGYSVNYSATAPSVDNATAVTLTTGTLAINSSSQVVTAGTTTVQAVSGEFTVSYNTTDGVTVEGLTTANESVKIGDNTYTLTAGDGFTVNVNGSTTTISGLSVGDQFTIDGQTFSYTNAGLTKIQDSTQYVLKTITPTGGSLTLTDLLSTDAWLGTRLASDGAVTINQSIVSDVIFVDNLTTPTVNYGQVIYENGAYTLESASGESPTSITIEQGVTATIASEYSSVPVTATQATAINVTKSNGLTYTIGGTISQFVPSTMTFTPATGDVFTVSDGTNSASYLMTAAGLTKTAENDTATNKIWTTAGITEYVLPDDNAWSNLLNLTNANVLDLSANSPETGSTIIVDSTNTTRWATLTYSASTYLLNSVDGNTPKIKLKDDTTNENYTINFATTVTTGTGTYTINEQSYTGSSLTVAVTADSSTLQDGTVTLDSTTPAVTATNGGSISVTSGTITATAQNGTWYTLNELTDGDIFKIGTTTYKVYGDSTLAKLNASGDPTEIYTSSISNGILTYEAITGDDYSAIVQLNSNNQLDLTQSITSAIVVGQNDGVIDPTVRIAQITYSDDAYTLSETSGGTIATLAGVLLGSTGTVKAFNTALETTVITSGVDTFTVNGKTFAAQNALTIATESSNGAFLTNGKISLAAGSTVTTRATSDDTIAATTGTLTVTADNTANTVTISGLDAGDVLSVNGTTYTMTAIGLTTGTKLNYNALKNSGITTSEFDLTDDAWKDIVATDSGVLTINNSIGSNVFVADVNNGIKYGTLTKADGAYTLTQADSNDTALAGVIVDGVKATLPITCTNTNITAKGATFKVTASEAFTIDASSTLLSMSEVTAVELVEGTLQATNNIPITASGNQITTTSGTMTVGIDDTGVFIGELTVGDTFTANGTNYEMTSAGLRDVDNQKLCTDITNNAYYLGATFNRIIEAPSGVLDLSSETQSAEVYDSITSPTTHMGTLTVSNGAFTLSAVSGGISTVTLGSGATLTVTFAATVNGSGTTTINNVTYTGTNLVIDATSTSSTLQSGTVTINSGGSVQATNDSTALAVTSGSITATAADGRFTSIASLDSGDVFTFNDKTYTQTAVGLMSSDNQLNEDVSTAVTVANLSGSAWQDIHQATGGALTINSSTSSAAVVVDITTDRAQSKRYGTLSKSGVTYTLTQADTDSTIASVTIDGVKASLPTTCVNTSITANDATFTVTASELFTIDATSTIPALSNVTAITLTSGTIQATNNIPVTVGENVITATSGTMTIGLDDTGIFVGGLNEDETFTVDGVEYKMTAAGLLDVTNQKICAAVTGTYYLGTEFSRIIEAPSGALDLSSETQGAEIYDSISSPTTHMGTLTVSGGKLTVTEVNGGISAITLAENATLTVNFATTVNGSGNTTVNSVAYNGTDLVINATATSSTLQSGTVTINNGGSVKATNDSTALGVTSGSITTTAADGYFTNIASLNSGDIFTFNSKTYTQTSLGLMSSDNQINESVSTAVTVTNLSGSAWKDIHQATSGALTISSSASSDAIVADITTDKAQCKRYGTLTKSGDTYTLMQADTDTQLTSITISGTKASLPTTCANTPITANSATFTVTASAAFTIDATSDIPSLSNVTAITLQSGTIQALNNIPITIGENVITSTSGTMTVGIDDTGVFVGGLNEGETFTVGSTSYKMTAAGLRDVTNQKILASVTDTYYLGTEFSRIIEAPSGALNLSDETQSAEVYDSIDSPTTHMATLTVSGGKLTLNAVDGGISTITLAENATLTVDFAATVNGSGNTTVNSVAYNGTSLVIAATATSSTLQSGTVTISNGSVKATNDTTALASTNGTITATAASGKFTNVASLDSGDIFTFNGKTYTQTSLGLLSSDNKLNEEVSTEVAISDLSGSAWQDITQATSGVLSINTETVASLVVDITDNKAQCQRYGTLTKSGTTYTLTQAETDSELTSLTLTGVKVSLPTTCADKTITANSATFTVKADAAFTVDATADIPILSNVTAITLNSGTIQALNNVPITVGENVITTTSGTMTVGIDDTGVFVGNLNEGETFTANDVEYKMTASGLRDVTNQTIRASVTDTYYLGTEFSRIIEAPNGTLNLSNETQSAEIYDSIDSPTTHMATLTVSGGKLTLNAVDGGISTITLAENATLTLDFAATVNGSGNTTVNSVAYNGTDLVIDATSTSSTLQSGTVTISNGSVKATNDTTALAATNGTITATAASGKFTNVASLDSGDIFTFNGKTYTQTSLGLLSSDNQLNEEVTTEVAISDLSGSAWQDITQATSGALSINSETVASLVVDITDNKAQCQRYGTLTKSGTTYTLTQAETDSELTSLTLTGVKVSLPTTCADKTIIANSATFTVKADAAFTVDTTADIPVLSNVTAITLNSGTIQALNNIPITVGDNEITTTSGTMTVGIDDTGVFVSNLNEGETFTANGVEYQMTASGLRDITNQTIRASVTDTYYLGTSFDRIIEAPNGVLNLGDETQSAEVYDSIDNPSTHMASLTVSGGKLTLNAVDGGISTITLAENATLTVDFAATVNSSGTTTVNSVAYNGTDLVIDATATSSTLQSGTVTISSGGSVQATKDTTALAATNGSITATAASGKFTTVASLDSGDIFTFNSKTYTQTSLGLLSSDNQLNEEVSKEVNVADLSGSAWQDITQATNGALTIDAETLTSLVVDITDNKSQCKRYGTLTKSGGIYELTTNSQQLTAITLTGVKSILPTTCANIPITANEATFTVTADEEFTIDATADIPTLSNVTGITLNEGTIQALNNIPITVGDNVITTTAGTMTVGVDSTGVFVGNLNADETFTVNDTEYKMTSSGLLDVTNQKIRASVTDTYYLGTDFSRIIESNGTLDLSNETESAEVYDSISNPAVHMATLTVNGLRLTLTEAEGGINTINLAENANLTVNFAATVNSSGTTTVNDKTYAGTTSLVIDATADSSTLKSGTITLNSTYSAAQATNDSTALEVTSGSINARAVNGKFTTLTKVNAGDRFSFNGNDYIQSAVGLINDSKISAALATTTLTISDFDSAKWEDFVAPSGGVLTLTDSTVSASVLDSATAPTTKLADLTVSDSRYSLKGTENADAIEAVTLPANSNLSVDFATQVYSPAGSVTVNSVAFNAASEVIIDSDGATATLYEGTVNLDTTNPTVTPSSDSSVLNVQRGTITATVFDGQFAAIGELDTRDSFTFNDTTYTKTAVGLMKDGLLSENLTDTTVEVADLSTATWSKIIVPFNQALDLTNTDSAIVCDDAANPTVKLATFTKADNVLTLDGNGDVSDAIKSVDIATGTTFNVDFATEVNVPSGTVIVNSNTYVGTSDLVLQSDGTTSTLTSGTVTLDKGDSVATTNGNNISVSDGDGISVTVGDNVTINGISNGDAFKVDDNSYKVTDSGLINTSGKFWTGADYGDGLTVDALNLATNWTGITVAKDGVLSVDSSTLANDETSTVVDDLNNPTITYGALSKSDDAYNLTANSQQLTAIKVDGVKIAIDNNFAGVPLTITTPDGTKTALNVTASAKSSSFTVDATGINPTVADVAAMEISAGKIELFDGQTITLTEDAQGVAVLAGNGTFNVGDETFTIADLADDTLVEFAFDADGNANSVVGFDKDSTVTIDGSTYVAPEDNAVLHYTTEDNWYFDGFAYDDYTVTVDSSGNVLVMPGVKFSDVISSGKVLADDGTIKFAADYNKTPITIINQGKTALNVNDADDNTLAENLSKNKNVTFNADGVETEDLTAVAGATFKLQDNKSLTAGDTKITANDNDCEIGIGEEGTSISADKDATITAPADITLTLNAGDYNVNGVDFTGSGTTAETTTSDGVEIDLATSDAITYDSMTLSSAGTATIDNSDGVTVTGGAKVTNADYRALTVDGTAYVDDKTINTAKATEVTTSSGGVRVSRRNVRISGDTDGYTVNIANLDIIGLENIGNSEGVTVNGLRDATIKTDKAGSLTAGDKTFIYSNDSVTYGLDSGSIVSISDAEQVIGDFSDKVSVNGDGIKLTGSEVVTLIADNNGVTKLELGAAGTYNVNGKIYEIQEDGAFAFGISGGAVSGVESVENGNLIISQNESGFGVNDATITLANNNPVTLGIVDSNIVSVSGVDGTINGLENATVYGLTNAVINRKPLRISGSDEYDAIVVDGVLTSIGAITDGAIIRSAPSVTVTTAENGTFTFDTTEYKINDTLDGSVDFTTDDNSRVIEINNFAGEISGVLEDVESLNGKKFNISGAGEVSVVSDGTEIVSITGITDGTTVNGDVADMHYVMPEGKVTVNGIAYELQGDDNGALFVSNDGRALNGLDKDATLSVGSAGNYTINGTRFTVDAGDAFTVNRDGVYVIDPNHPPISEKSDADDILNRGENPVYVRPTATGEQTVDLTGDNDLALIDSAEANVTVQAGAGNDSVVVRHGAAVDVNLDENGSTLIIPTAGQVTLENYNGDNAAVQTFDYSNLTGAIKSNDIKFGDGVMTLGDAIVTYDAAATETGATEGTLINAHGRELEIGFTHQKGGVLDESTSDDNYLMKGNYAESTSDTQKGGGSTILTGSGNDTILAGAGDYIDAGGGYNQIYLTDKRLRNSVPEGATIVLSDESYNTVSNFAGGFSGDDDQILIKNLGELGFGYGAGDLVMSAGSGQITFEDLTADNHYELKLTDGTNEYKAAIAKKDSVLAVDNSNEAEIFYGNENGISFSEYTGAVEVNLNENAGSLNGTAVQYYGMNKVTGGAGDTSLIGAANTPNTLTAGTGNGSIWSNSGRDLMVGNTDAGKSGTTTFFYMPGDGRDTITNFDFMSGTTDITADKIEFDDASGVTNVFLSGDDVVIGINNSADDYLRLVDARGKSFRVNDDLIAKVDKNVEFDGFSNVYVGTGAPSTLTVGEGMGNVEIWLSDDSLEYHGIWYDGNFAVLDASKSDGSNILAGNESDNLIIGGAGSNSIWGGYASSNDTLVGGSGQNTFFFAVENGHDVIRNAHDGDLVSLEDIYLENIARADITGGGAIIELTDGSRLEVQSSAAIDYRLQDGTTYTADRRTGEWVQK